MVQIVLHTTEPCLSHQHAYWTVINCDEPNNRTGVHCPGWQQQPLSQSLADPACCLLVCLTHCVPRPQDCCQNNTLHAVTAAEAQLLSRCQQPRPSAAMKTSAMVAPT
jgi:hypothetical protein